MVQEQVIAIPIVIYKHKIIMYASKLKQVVIKFTNIGFLLSFHLKLKTLPSISHFFTFLGMCSMQYVENTAADDSFELQTDTAITATGLVSRNIFES